MVDLDADCVSVVLLKEVHEVEDPDDAVHHELLVAARR
jgi:hypothetical protein